MAAQEQQRQVQQYQTQWDQFAAAEDAKFDKLMPTGSAIAKDAMQTLRSAGFSDQDVSKAWRGEATISLRDSRVQVLLWKSAMYDRAIAALPAARSNPVPAVQKPSTRNEAYFAEAAPRMPAQFKGAREAAEFLMQRRGRR
jgi:hypothetical protein